MRLLIIAFTFFAIATGSDSANLIEYEALENENAENMIKACSDTCRPTFVTFDPKFLEALNRYESRDIDFIPAIYDEEGERRYRARWHLDPSDERGAVKGMATMLVKVDNIFTKAIYFDEAGICPPPANCAFPFKPAEAEKSDTTVVEKH